MTNSFFFLFGVYRVLEKSSSFVGPYSETQKSPMLFWGQNGLNILQNIFFCAPKKKLFMPSHTETYMAN